MNNDIRHLISYISVIDSKYSLLDEVTDNNYNIFQILKIENDEVHFHSKILSDILSPQGLHGMKDTFLNLFINVLLKKSYLNSEFVNLLNEFNSKRTFVKSEYYLSKNTENESGGRVDILLHDDSNNIIVIENKLFAADQFKQILRYKQKLKKSLVVYLTLYGSDPSKLSKGDLKVGEDFINISYKDDICDWLLLCIEKVSLKPKIRETLLQYYILLKKITAQSMNENQKNEVVSYLSSSGNNFKAALNISASIEGAKLLLFQKIANQLKDKIIKYAESSVIVEIDNNFGKQYCPFCVFVDDKEDVYLQLSFLSDLSNIYLEVFNEENEKGTKKDINNISFYRNELDEKATTWGKIENTEKKWWGDWVCRYKKFDDFFNLEDGWIKTADNDFTFLDSVAMDMITVLEAIKKNYNLK